MRCANSEALNRYEREQEELDKLAEIEELKEKKEEEKYRKFTEAMIDNLASEYTHLINEVIELADEYDISLSYDEAEDLFLNYMA